MKKVVILSNHHMYTYNFRKEIIERLIQERYKVYIVLPYGDKVENLKEMGCEFIDIQLDRRGMNPIKDLKLLIRYYKILKKIKPNAVLTYTIKPNLYGGFICRILNIPFFPNITGLGTAIGNKTILQKFLIQMYKLIYKKAACVFFQNEENYKFFLDNNIQVQNYQIIPGSGVNINYFKLLEYPPEDKVEFVFISRVMKEKGIDQYLEAAQYIRQKYPHTRFHVLGFCEEDYETMLLELHKKGIIQYHGMQCDIRPFLKRSHCTVHPTYYPEGMSNVLLESAASGRPIITTNRPGCREIVDDRINGLIVREKDSQDLIEKLEYFINLDYDSKREMGINGRLKIEKKFDREKVVQEYLNQLKKIDKI